MEQEHPGVRKPDGIRDHHDRYSASTQYPGLEQRGSLVDLVCRDRMAGG